MAHYTVVFAKTSPEKGTSGITAFVVDMSLPGVSCGRNEEKMGQKGIPVSDIILENVHIPSSCIIGEIDRGFINAMKSLNVGRIGIAAMSLGMAEEALDLAIQYTKVRKQFGKPLAEHQKEFAETFDFIFPKLLKKKGGITLKVNGAPIDISYSDIIYIDVFLPLTVYVDNTLRTPLKHIEFIRKLVDDNFGSRAVFDVGGGAVSLGAVAFK